MLFVSKQLHYFIIAAQTLCLNKAAQLLYITPSPLSRCILKIEEEIGFKLFIRKPEGFSLTSKGKDLYLKVIPLYQQLVLLDKGIKNEKSEFGTLKISSNGLATSFCAELADKLTALTPPIYLHMQKIPNSGVAVSLRNFTSDLCIVTDPLDQDGDLYCEKLPDESVKLAVSEEYAHYDTTYLMKHFPLVQYDSAPDNGHINRIRDYFHRNDISPKYLHLSEMSQRLNMVQQGVAVSLVPASTINMISDNSIQLLNLPADFPLINRYIYCLKEHTSRLKDVMSLLECCMKHSLNRSQ